MTRVTCLAGLAGMVACGALAHHPSPVAQQVQIVDVPATVGIVGINGGFHGPIPADVIDHDCARGTAPFEYRSPVLDVDQAQAVLESVLRCDHVVLDLVIEQDDRALASALGGWAVAHPDRVVDIECGNELDISPIVRGGGKPSTLDGEQFATWVFDCAKALRDKGYGRRVVSGGVYALTDDTWAYLQPTIKLCAAIDCDLGLHDYDNFEAAWMDKLDGVGLRWKVTETGAHSITPAEDAGQAAFLRAACAGLSRAHVSALFVYQGQSGPSTSNLDNFGTRYFTPAGSPLRFKPADDVVTRMTQGHC